MQCGLGPPLNRETCHNVRAGEGQVRGRGQERGKRDARLGQGIRRGVWMVGVQIFFTDFPQKKVALWGGGRMWVL